MSIPLVAPPGLKDDGKELQTKEAAKFLGISRREFDRRLADGLYVPTRVDEHGWKYYSVEYLLQARRKIRTGKPGSSNKPTTAPPHRFNGSLAIKSSAAVALSNRPTYVSEDVIRIYDELEIDEDLVRIVKKTSMMPAVVRQIYAEWRDLRREGGGFYVSGEVLRKLNGLGLDGFPVKTPEAFALALEALASIEDPCECCKAHPRRRSQLCQGCYEGMQRTAIAEAVEEAKRETRTRKRGREGRKAAED